jgi:hypothetical protein
MRATIKKIQDKIQETEESKSGRILLIIAAVCFLFMVTPEPSKLIPGVGEVEEVAAGGIGLTAILIYFVRYWLFLQVKKAVFNKK